MMPARVLPGERHSAAWRRHRDVGTTDLRAAAIEGTQLAEIRSERTPS
jgi:hypothetical protein